MSQKTETYELKADLDVEVAWIMRLIDRPIHWVADVIGLEDWKMGTSYERDVVAWASEQAALLRAGKFSALDIEHLAEEIEDVGKSEQRELSNRVAALLAHLLKWQYQTGRQGLSWLRTIKEQRKSIEVVLKKTPSLGNSLIAPDWIRGTWADTVARAAEETGLDVFPETCPCFNRY